jgi:hypothetical protein
MPGRPSWPVAAIGSTTSRTSGWPSSMYISLRCRCRLTESVTCCSLRLSPRSPRWVAPGHGEPRSRSWLRCCAHWHRNAVEHPPRGARPERRATGDGRQDVQGDDRRAARLADRALIGPGAAARRARGAPATGVRGEIEPDGVQASIRYPGGVALRFARVQRYRPDKTPVEADTTDAVRALLPDRSR